MKNNSFNINQYINNKELNILKAVLPHIPANYQKFLAIYIAMKELSNIFNLINAISNNSFITTNSCNSELDISKIFESVKTFLNPDECETIDNYLNAMSMMKMMNEMSAMSEENFSSNQDSSTSNGFNMDILKSMLTPEQSAIFDSLSNNN